MDKSLVDSSCHFVNTENCLLAKASHRSASVIWLPPTRDHDSGKTPFRRSEPPTHCDWGFHQHESRENCLLALTSHYITVD